MFDVVSILARYLFLFYIVYFLWQGLVYIFNERRPGEKGSEGDPKKQRYTIIVMHIMAFAVLFLKPLDKESVIDFGALIMGAASLAFIISGFILTKKLYKNACPILFNGVFFLLDIGFIMLFRLSPELAQRQLVFCAAGFAVMLLIPVVFRIIPKFEKMKYLYLAAGLGLLLALFVLGKEEYGSKSWIQIGGISFQPSEFAKVFFVLYFASALRNKLGLFKALAQCAIAAVFVVILVWQRDFGGALLFFMTFMIMIYAATGNLSLFLLGTGGAGGVMFALFKYVPQLTAHIDTRISAWLNPWSDIRDKGYQITQSLFAICTWGPFGSGLLRGQPGKIPVVERDFIFAAISEEFGSIFGLLLIGVYIMIFYRGVHIALRCKTSFHSLISLGFTGLLAFQTFIILGGVTKLIPMTGVTMPFISYGGSSVFICVVIIGFLQWLYGESAKETFDSDYKQALEDEGNHEQDGYIDLTGGDSN